jgi:hypothetical protein
VSYVQKEKEILKEMTSFNPGRHGGRLLSALNRAIGIGNPYCKNTRINYNCKQFLCSKGTTKNHKFPKVLVIF